MPNDKPNMGTARVSFPSAKQSTAQREEDSFMRTHGSIAARLVFRAFDFQMRWPTAKKCISGVIKSLAKRPNRILR